MCSRTSVTAPITIPAYLAIRAAIDSGTTMTYKILFNDAVAMTGGQANEGGLNVPQIARQVAAEGASPRGRGHRRAVEISKRYRLAARLDRASPRRARRRSSASWRACPGSACLIYDQTCAAEKRRRRKRGAFPDPDKRVVINDLVCEGCGDCGVKSNCVSVQPLETEWGRKRIIDQSSCNKDYSCIKGFCPSFVTVHGARLKKGESVAEPADWPALPSPSLPLANHPYGIIVTGIGGTGIVTIGAIVAMAAHLEGKGVGVIDMAGLAQKGGAVFSHIRIANTPDDIHAIRVAAGGADLVLGGDIVVAGSKKVLSAIKQGNTRVVINTAEFLPGDFTRNADYSLPTERLKRAITGHAGRENSYFVAAGKLATALLGNSIGANMFMLGYAYQLGALPLSAEAIEKAIEMNGEAVAMNIAAFRYGRRAAVDPAAGGIAGDAAAAGSQRLAEILAKLRRDRRAPRRLSYRLSERTLCQALSPAGGEAARGGGREGARPMRTCRSGGALSVQADGLQGRIRGGAALHRHRLPRAGAVAPSTATICASNSIWRRPCWRGAIP